MTSYIIIAVVVIILLAIVIGFISAYNSLVKLRNSVEEAFATMDVYLKKRWDLIPNIVASLFGFKKQQMYAVDDSAQRENVKVEF